MAPARPISRRDFILAGSLGVGALLVARAANRTQRPLLSGDLGNPGTLVVARRNGNVAEMVDQCLGALGGIGAFVWPGAKVAIKVNASWSNPSANVQPEVVRQVVLQANAAGPSRVTVYDHLIQGGGWGAIASAAQSAGAQASGLGESASQYISKAIPGVGLKSAMVAKVLDEADVLINLPVLKTHSEGEVTIGLKNHMGSVLDGGGHGLQQGIADINACPTIRGKHRLTICDALSPMVTGGPSSGTHANYNGIIAGTDPVATDYIGTQIIRRYNPGLAQNPAHLTKSAALGLGTNNPAEISFDERNVSQPVPELWVPGAAVGLAALRALVDRAGFKPGA